MGPLRELLATDHRQALEFFFQRLKDVSGQNVDHRQLLYNASVLAHYAQVSGRQVDDIDYYCVLAKWKLAVVLEQGYQRAKGDPKLEAFGNVVLDLMRGAAELAGTTDYAS